MDMVDLARDFDLAAVAVAAEATEDRGTLCPLVGALGSLTAHVVWGRAVVEPDREGIAEGITGLAMQRFAGLAGGRRFLSRREIGAWWLIHHVPRPRHIKVMGSVAQLYVNLFTGRAYCPVLPGV